jgi:hypothetical protein
MDHIFHIAGRSYAVRCAPPRAPLRGPHDRPQGHTRARLQLDRKREQRPCPELAANAGGHRLPCTPGRKSCQSIGNGGRNQSVRASCQHLPLDGNECDDLLSSHTARELGEFFLR